jgi:hypothetical protein
LTVDARAESDDHRREVGRMGQGTARQGDANEELDDEVRVSGMRERDRESERETTPAPASSTSEAYGRSIQVSSRPTSVPDFDLSALAAGASLKHDALPSLPADVTVPIRLATTPPADLAHRLAALLFHVDGRASIADIAACVDLPPSEVTVAFLELAGLDLVELATPR